MTRYSNVTPARLFLLANPHKRMKKGVIVLTPNQAVTEAPNLFRLAPQALTRNLLRHRHSRLLDCNRAILIGRAQKRKLT
jgi:hypothetical protein